MGKGGLEGLRNGLRSGLGLLEVAVLPLGVVEDGYVDDLQSIA